VLTLRLRWSRPFGKAIKKAVESAVASTLDGRVAAPYLSRGPCPGRPPRLPFAYEVPFPVIYVAAVSMSAIALQTSRVARS
jgi:hypothetical protein